MKATGYFDRIKECERLCVEWMDIVRNADRGLMTICLNEKHPESKIPDLLEGIRLVDKNDVIVELSSLKKSVVREICRPLFGKGYDIPITENREPFQVYREIMGTKKDLVISMMNGCGFSGYDDLFPIPDFLKCKPDNDPFQRNNFEYKPLYAWCIDEGIINHPKVAAISFEDFIQRIVKADFSEMYNAPRAKHKVCAIIRYLYDFNAFVEKDKWLSAVSISINLSEAVIKKKGCDYYKIDKNKPQNNILPLKK